MPENDHEPPVNKVSCHKRVKVLIVGGLEVLQRALRELIASQPDIEVSMVTRDLLDASRWLKRDVVQVMIVDWPVLEQGAGQIINDLMRLQPHLKWLAVSLFDDDFIVKQAFAKGINGYVTKAMAADKICEAIRMLQKGQRYCSPDVMYALPDLIRQHISYKNLNQ